LINVKLEHSSSVMDDGFNSIVASLNFIPFILIAFD
jgi:hypothetical protein